MENNHIKNTRILIIDDNEQIHDDFRKILHNNQKENKALADVEKKLFKNTKDQVVDRYIIDASHQGEEGVELIRRALESGDPYALAIIDVRMPPGIDGVETITKIWKIQPDLHIVLCTAYSDYSWKELVEKLGYTDKLVILKKPFDNSEVRQLIYALKEKHFTFLLAQKKISQLSKVNKALGKEIAKRKIDEEEIKKLNEDLEKRIKDRTIDLENRIVESEQLNKGLINITEDMQLTNARIERAKKELTLANNELEAFAYSVSHDLRAPLRHISGFTSILKESNAGKMDDESTRHLNNISESAKQMGQLIDDLLIFSRIGRAVVQKTNVDLNILVKKIRGDMKHEIQHRKMTWKINKLPIVPGDQPMLQQVLVNLISNAVKFTAKKDTTLIEIGYQSNKNENIFYIRDNGVGFDMKYIDKLFKVFQRLHTAKDFEGTGIGLANVQRIIQRHGGRVWAESILDEGAVFYFTLPK
ncbi:MAG: response regulator [Deltaproteobacteria bacterium]|nr:response regulator [Candidatus Desulfobacula maris]MBL6964719.1 response regulator [Bacteroidota bacterium]